MNRYILIRRLRGPAILLLIGSIALMHSTGLVHSFWRWFWPLLFIVLGLLLLAERAALASEESLGGWPNGGVPNQGGYPGGYDPQTGAAVPPYQPYQGQPTGQAPGQPAESSSAIVPVGPHDIERNGGQS